MKLIDVVSDQYSKNCTYVLPINKAFSVYIVLCFVFTSLLNTR